MWRGDLFFASSNSLFRVKGFMKYSVLDNIQSHRDELAENGFLTHDDLQLNRHGYLSEGQQKTLYKSIAVWVILITANTIGIISLLCFQIFTHGEFSEVNFWIVLLIGVIVLCAVNAKPILLDIKYNKVKMAEGRIFKHFSASGGGKSVKIGHCTIRIRNYVFTVNPALYDVLEEDNERHYRLFFTPYTNKIVNIEPY